MGHFCRFDNSCCINFNIIILRQLCNFRFISYKSVNHNSVGSRRWNNRCKYKLAGREVIMIDKRFRTKNKINAEKYFFIILLFSYITGICIGSYFVFSDSNTAEFTKNILTDSNFKVILYFFISMLLKYAGVLSGIIFFVPMLFGIQNSADYCCYILEKASIKYETALTPIKDTAVAMLLILYIVVILNQAFNNKYNVKRDIKLLSVYVTGNALPSKA